MAATTSKRKTTKSRPTYAISYGLAGGPAHARKLKRHLHQAGYVQSRQVAKADIIIAHSGGCWLIPELAKPRLVIYVGMPLAQANPRQTWLAAQDAMLKHGQLKHSLRTRAKNTFYTLRQPRRNLKITRMAKTAQPIIFPGSSTVFIANRHDPWPRSPQTQEYLDNYDWSFLSLPGPHDDIWEHSERYAVIIDHYARLLA
jgi:hypothetical protein